MTRPVVAESAPVVGGDEEGGPVAVEGVGLDGFPEFADKAVGAVGRFEVGLVIAVVGEVVGLAVGDVEEAGGGRP